MEYDGKIAEITIEPKTEQVINITFNETPVRFRCLRCAVFCCKLGGPKLLPMDIERLKEGGCDPDMFLDVKRASLKSKNDGSCIFLSLSTKEGIYQCSVYNFRPSLCRLYPFQFEKSGQNTHTLKFIPCCNGLNTEDGETIDANFFVKFLQKVFFDLIDSNTL